MLMASLQSDSARSGSFLAHHHPQRLLNATARLGPFISGSLSARSQAVMFRSALSIWPANLHCASSLSLSARAGPVMANNAANPASGNEKRMFPPSSDVADDARVIRLLHHPSVVIQKFSSLLPRGLQENF